MELLGRDCTIYGGLFAATLLHGSAAGRSQPPHPLSCEANVLRAPQLQHAVQRGDSNDHLGGLPPFGPRMSLEAIGDVNRMIMPRLRSGIGKPPTKATSRQRTNLHLCSTPAEAYCRITTKR
jgi:hypothetical protein